MIKVTFRSICLKKQCPNLILQRKYCDKEPTSSEMVNKTEQQNTTKEFPEEPTTCCMSGCANCVWLDYAEKLSAYFKDGGERAIKEINEKVQDPNIKTFLLHELRMRNKT